MLLAVDSLADRYGKLPSEIIEQASTFDLYVLNAGIEWRNKQQAVAEAGSTLPTPHLSLDEMKQMMESVKGTDDGKDGL